MERFVLDQLQNHLFNDRNIPQLTAELNRYIADTEQDTKENKTMYKQRIAQLETNKAHILDAIAKTGFSDIFAEKLTEIESELAATTELLQRLEQTENTSVITEDMVRGYLGACKEFILKRDVPQIKKFIDSYVECVDVYHEKVVVTFKVDIGALGDQAKETLSYNFQRDTTRKALKTA